MVGLSLTGPGAQSTRAQTVEFEKGSRGSPQADQAVQRILSRANYAVWVRDTVLAVGERVSRDVILIGATLHVEGIIEGDLVAVQSDVFARPGGEFGGLVVVLAGGFYGSSLADLSAPPIDASIYDYTIRSSGVDRYVIAAPGGEAEARLPGFYGFLAPDYDRVNALTIQWGLDVDRGQATWLPDAEARVRFRSVRTTVEGDLALSWPFSRHAAVLSGGRSVRSNDRWINADLINSLSSIWAEGDYRNYYDAWFVDGGVRLEHGTTTVWNHALMLGWERARSLPNEDPFSVFDYRGPFAPNLPVAEADVVSLKLESRTRLWTGNRSRGAVELSFEYADEDIAGDLSYTLFGAALEGSLPTFGRQSLGLLARGQIPGTDDAPPQRWRALGGWGTLPTLDAVEQVGDRMWFIETSYEIPTGVDVEILGELVTWLRWAAGNVRSDVFEARPRTVHNLGLGLTLGIIEGGVFTDPGDDFHTVVLLGLVPRP